MICGWCQGSGVRDGKSCSCQTKKKAYFPGKGKPKKKSEGYAFDKAHKCGPSVQEFLERVGHYDWFLCECGKTEKVYVD